MTDWKQIASEYRKQHEKDTNEIARQVIEIIELEKQLKRANIMKAERQTLLEMTTLLDEHPEGYEGPCLCQECCSCSGEISDRAEDEG